MSRQALKEIEVELAFCLLAVVIGLIGCAAKTAAERADLKTANEFEGIEGCKVERLQGGKVEMSSPKFPVGMDGQPILDAIEAGVVKDFSQRLKEEKPAPGAPQNGARPDNSGLLDLLELTAELVCAFNESWNCEPVGAWADPY